MQPLSSVTRLSKTPSLSAGVSIRLEIPFEMFILFFLQLDTTNDDINHPTILNWTLVPPRLNINLRIACAMDGHQRDPSRKSLNFNTIKYSRPPYNKHCNGAIRINQISSRRQVPLSFKNVINASYWSCGMSLILMK